MKSTGYRDVYTCSIQMAYKSHKQEGTVTGIWSGGEFGPGEPNSLENPIRGTVFPNSVLQNLWSGVTTFLGSLRLGTPGPHRHGRMGFPGHRSTVRMGTLTPSSR